MKIFIGLNEVAGYYSGLNSGFKQIGVESHFFVYYDDKRSYGGDDSSSFFLARLVKRLCQRAGKVPPTQRFRRAYWRFVRDFSKIPFFIWALCKYDVFILGFNSTFFVPRFFSYYDYPILKFFGKKIICQYHGSDSRPPFVDGAIMNNIRSVNVEECMERTSAKKRILQKINKYADIIIDIPPQGYLHDKPYIMWMEIGIPYNIAYTPVIEEQAISAAARPVRILHAPSDAAAKGTKRIREAIASLSNKGYSIDFIEIQNMPNHVVREELAKCDIVVDQLYSDYPMPGFATEAAWYGKPVVIGGYAYRHWGKWLVQDKLPPTHYCHPENIEAAIERLVADQEYRLELGRKAKFFVQNEWHPKAVAGRYLALIRDEIPDRWWFDPNSTDYYSGMGMDEPRIKSIIRKMIETGGIESLKLSDKPDLEEAFKQFAYSED